MGSCYPFGLRHKGYNNVINGTDHPYGFGGMEENDELGLNWLDFSARNYDASLGRWMNIDPLAEQMRRHSPYNFAFDNPVYFIDPDGMAPFGTNPITGIGQGIARAVESRVNKISKSVSDGWNNITSTVSGWFGGGSSSSSSRESGSGDGFSFVTSDGQSSGDSSLVTNTSGNVTEVDVTGIMALTVVAGGKKSSKGDGMTNATDLSKKNAANTFADGADAVRYVGNAADAIDTAGSINTANTKDSDTTVTATFAGGIKDFNPEMKGGLMLLERTDSTATMKKGEVDKFNQSAKQSILNQEQKAKNIKHEDIDINNNN